MLSLAAALLIGICAGGIVWGVHYFLDVDKTVVLSPLDACRACVCGVDGKRCECVGQGYVASPEWQQVYQACGHCLLPACNEPLPTFVLRKQ